MSLILISGFVAVYFLLILGTILYTRLRSTGSILPGLSEFLLAGRDIPVGILILTFIGSLFSTAAVIAFPGFVALHGISGVLFFATGDLIGLAFAWFFYNKLRRYAADNDLYSPIECLWRSYQNRALGVLMAGLSIVFLVPYITLQLVGIGAFLESVSDGQVGYVTGVSCMLGVVAVYVVLGGMRAVAFTDAVQAIAIMLGFFGGLFYFANLYWDGPVDMVTTLVRERPEHWALPGPAGLFTPLYTISAVFIILGFFVQPQLLSRGLMARDERQIKIMVIGVAIGVVLIVIPIALFGIGGYDRLAGEDGTIESSSMMGQIFSTIGDSGWIGLIIFSLFLVGSLGAAMSTADSMLLASGQVVGRDIIRPFKRLPRGRQVVVSRMVMVVVMIVAYVIGLSPPQVMLDLALMSISASCAFVPVYLGFLWKYRSAGAAITAVSISTLWLVGMKFFAWPQFGLHEGFITLVSSSIIYIAFCLIRAFSSGAIQSSKPRYRAE